MVYGIAFIGLIAGFILGQMVLLVLLRHKTKEELVLDESLKWKYGTLNWLIALISAFSFVFVYNLYSS